MSSATTAPSPERYAKGRDRYVRFAEEILGLEVAETQARVLRAVAEHERVHVESGNGVGKSFVAAVLNLAFLYTNPDSIAMATSGTYSVLTDVLWKPMRRLATAAQRDQDLPGRCLENPPRLRLDDEWYFKAVSPTYPENLEGRHAGTMLVTIEEVDKPDIEEAHFDSAGSMLTDGNDRFLAISNPPRDEANVAYRLSEDDRWHTIRFSSFESHNVLVDAGELDAPKIPGLVDLQTIRDDWENWNDEPWPGFEEARVAHEHRDDLDERWYRRRAGIMPPAGAQTHRPITPADVQAAWNRGHDPAVDPDGTGIDVARSGDRTVLASTYGPALEVRYAERGTNHTAQEDQLRRLLDADTGHAGAIDAMGEGSGLADRLCQAYPDLQRFGAGKEASAADEYYDCWAEGLALLGQYLREEGSITDRTLREELLVAARTVEFTEQHYASRGPDGTTVLKCTSKDAVKDRLGRSPDLLDAAYMAVWARDTEPVQVTRRRGGETGRRRFTR